MNKSYLLTATLISTIASPFKLAVLVDVIGELNISSASSINLYGCKVPFIDVSNCLGISFIFSI